MSGILVGARTEGKGERQPMKDKTVLITGANAGIGLATALGLAKLGARVLMVSRDEGRGRKAQALVKEKSGNWDVHLLIAELSDRDSIRGMARKVREEFGALHVLVNNAAVIPRRREVTEDGLEMQFAVNHLSYFLLTGLLLDMLKANAPARVVNVSSQVHAGATIDFDDLQSERDYSRTRVYGRSKLANVLFTYELARRLEGTGVTANCLHPGVVATNLLADAAGMPRPLKSATRVVAVTAESGARTSIYLASSEEVEGVNGKYFVKRRAVESSRESHDKAAARRLWEVSCKLTGLDPNWA